MRHSFVVPFTLLLVLCPIVPAQNATTFDLKIVPIKEGNWEATQGEVADFEKLPMVQAARRLGIDPADPAHPLFQHICKNQRFFYLFYNNVEKVPDGAYLIQRIKKTDSVIGKDGFTSYSESYQVEAMKSLGGRIKQGNDQHFGYFGLRNGATKRTITKVFEIGIGSIPGKAAPGFWPFPEASLFEMIQPYQPEPGLHGKVAFKEVLKWSLTLTFDHHGNYEFRVPELGLEATMRAPAVDAVPPPAAAKVVLTAGQGLPGLRVGASTLADIQRVFGENAKVYAAGVRSANHEVPGLALNVTQIGRLNTIFTRPGFAGKTAKGVRHGSTREEVLRTYGKPDGDTATYLAYDAGIHFHFNPDRRVERIVITVPE